jgi:hypothetical protein
LLYNKHVTPFFTTAKKLQHLFKLHLTSFSFSFYFSLLITIYSIEPDIDSWSLVRLLFFF